MRNSVDAIDEIKEIKNISGRRSIREGGGGRVAGDSYDEALLSRKKALNNNEDRSISEPPQSRYNNHMITAADSMRLKTICEKMDDNQCSSDEEDFKSNSQLNGSDLDLEIPESASQTPTPTPLMVGSARRINSETNLNDQSRKRLTGFMGNRSKRFCASTSELSFSSHLDTNKSLFSPKNNQGSRSGSLYGSNMSLNSNNSRLFMANSPFYSGKTTFGGASAYPRKDINQHKILRNPIQMRPSSSLSNSSATSTKSEGAGYAPQSNATKHIMEVMAQFSGPLKETRSLGSNINSMIKVPGLTQNQKRFGEEDLQLNRSVVLSRPTAPYSRPIGGAATPMSQKNTPESIASSLLNASSASPQVPTMSQLLKMKRLQNSTERVREIANRSESFFNEANEYKLPSSNDVLEGRKGGGLGAAATDRNSTNSLSSSTSLKMKNNITKNLLRNDKASANDQPPEPLNLPNVQLPELKSYPKFDIKLPMTSESSAMSKSTTVSFKTNSNTNTITSSTLLSTTLGTSSVQNNFNFTEKLNEKTLSSPLKPTTATTTAKSAMTMMNKENFTFSMPIIFDAGANDALNTLPTGKFVFSTPLRIDGQEKMVNTTKSMDSKSQSSAASDNLFKSLVAKQSSQWECDSCLTRNDNEKTKCLCCETVRPGSETSSSSSSKPQGLSKNVTSSSSPPAPSSDDLFKKLAAQQNKSLWECDACMTKNELDKEKCLCCETPKPGSKPSPSASSSLLSTSSSFGGFKFGMPSSEPVKSAASDDLFKTLAAQQKKSQWECDACMTRNDSDKDKCACCETPKPGAKAATAKSENSALSTSSFSFGVKPSAIETSAKFSFGMPTLAAVTTPEPKPVDPGFKKILEKQNASWECSACMTRNDQSQAKCICCEQVKPGSSDNQPKFSFASKSAVSLPPPSEVKFSFGVQSTKSGDTASPEAKKDSDKESKQKKDEVDKPVSTGFSFGASSGAEITGFKFGNTNAATESKPASTESNAAPSFTFKAPAASNAVSASFTLSAPKEEEKKESTDGKEGGEKALKSCLGIATTADAKQTDKKVSFSLDVSKETLERPGGFSFPAASLTPSASSNIFGSVSAPNTNGGMAFGNPAKPAEETKAESTAPKALQGGFQFSSSTASPVGFSFGAKTAAETTSVTQASNLFSFGAHKTENAAVGGDAVKTFGTFVNSTPATTTPAASPFSPALASTAAPANMFGSSAGFAFGTAKKDENTAPTQTNTDFSFGAKSATMVFGSTQNATSGITPVFGASNSMPTFASNIGNNATTVNNNNENAFSTKMSGFGGIQASTINQPQKRSFDFSSPANAATDGIQNKKFDFGQQQQSQASSAPFGFSAQPETKSAFSFTAGAPAFNFTANNSSNTNPNVSNTQENLFQFGANNSSGPQQGIFAFGANTQAAPQMQPQQPATAPAVMAFGPPAMGGLNPAFNPGTGGASPQRKILRANRRNVTRR